MKNNGFQRFIQLSWLASPPSVFGLAARPRGQRRSDRGTPGTVPLPGITPHHSTVPQSAQTRERGETFIQDAAECPKASGFGAEHI